MDDSRSRWPAEGTLNVCGMTQRPRTRSSIRAAVRAASTRARDTPDVNDAGEIVLARGLFALQRARRDLLRQEGTARRLTRLARLRAAVLAHRERLIDAVFADFSKPAFEAEVFEIRGVLNEIDAARRGLAEWMRPTPVRGGVTLGMLRAELRWDARGVALILAPWNYPILLLLAPLVSAIAAGCPAILRPSEKTPHTAAALRALVADACEPDEAAVILGGVEVATALLDLPFDHIFFTGSPAVGRIVMTAAARHLASVTLELGGKSPAIILEDADLASAARRIAWGKFINAGQTCVAPDFVLVPRLLQERLANELALAIARFYGSDPASRARSPDFPRLVDAAAHRRLTRTIAEARAHGARLVIGGEGVAERRYLAPTVLADVDWSSPAMGEELFGPLLPLVPYDTLDDAIERVRRMHPPLALYAFGVEQSRIERVLARLPSGGAVVNDVVIQFGHPELPVGGVGESGAGSYHGVYGFRAFSHQRPVVWQRRRSPLALIYPPYGRRAQAILAALRRLGD